MVKHSLLMRVGVAMAMLFSLAVIGMVSSLTIAKTNEGFAAAINQAGTLRMQSYRIASSLAQGISTRPGSASTRQLFEEFEQRLHSQRIHSVLDRQTRARVTEAYQQVASQWHEQMLPQLQSYVALQEASSPGDAALVRQMQVIQDYYLAQVDGFVDNIHHFVKVLELDAEEKIQQLRIIQIVALGLTLAVALVSVYLTKVSVLGPLDDLLAFAKAARHGDFSQRSRHTAEDELGQLGAAFNLMAEDLSKLYTDLGDRVREKTADLERSNRSLELLYSAATRLSDPSLSAETLQQLIHDIEHYIGVKSGSICLGQPGDQQAFRMAFTRNICQDPDDLTRADCASCLHGSTTCVLPRDGSLPAQGRLLAIPIRDQAQQHGVLMIELHEDKGLEEWQQRMLETVASHIAMALNLGKRTSQNRMLALLEERSVIARELHDSLAQTLSYLKIQVSKLDRNVSADSDKESILAITSDLRDALNGAYRQLRELLKTFRLRISEAGLGVALEETVQEFRERGDMEIELNNLANNCRFSPNAEIHIVQIIREALSNVVRHAKASRARVVMECDLDGQVTLLVDDNGVGIKRENDTLFHYGMPIMRERADWLGAELNIDNLPSGGTRVKLTFDAASVAEGEPSETLNLTIHHG